MTRYPILRGCSWVLTSCHSLLWCRILDENLALFVNLRFKVAFLADLLLDLILHVFNSLFLLSLVLSDSFIPWLKSTYQLSRNFAHRLWSERAVFNLVILFLLLQANHLLTRFYRPLVEVALYVTRRCPIFFNFLLRTLGGCTCWTLEQKILCT